MRRPGLYLHVPFCSRVCPYCDFAVVRDRPDEHRRLVERLLLEAEAAAGDWRRGDGGNGGDGGAEPTPFDTVYLGGGTPSVLAPERVETLLDGLRRRLPVADDAWILLEANPEDATAERLEALARLGVRTLSLGVQSFHPEELRFLGRRHRPDDARRAFAQARAAGFSTVSLDLIFGLPEHLGRRGAGASAAQTSTERPSALERLETSLAATVELAPDHVSCYQLTVHGGTPFGRARERGSLRELAEDDQARAFERLHRVLGAAGYRPYEVSNFARTPEHRSRHNPKYWDHTPYLGLGPGAHSFDGRRRWWNERSVDTWARRLEAGERPVAEVETLDDAQLALERLMLGLRTIDGVDLGELRRRYGLDLRATDADTLERLARRGLVTLDGDRLAPTVAGLAVADGLPAALRLE